MARQTTPKTRERFLEALKATNGNITRACQIVKISRLTYYNWLEKFPDFAKECDMLIDEKIDVVEDALFANIQDGDTASIIFFLKTIGRRRGYIERPKEQESDQKIDQLLSTLTLLIQERDEITNELEQLQKRLAKYEKQNEA